VVCIMYRGLDLIRTCKPVSTRSENLETISVRTRKRIPYIFHK